MSRFLNWFERIAHPECALESSGMPDHLARAARVLAAGAPRLRLVPDYPARLADAAATALEYARALADELGEPVVLDKGVWDRNPLIPLIFPSPEQGLDFLRSAVKVHDVLAGTPARTCHILLAMQRRESTTFGYEQQGEILRKDVLQTAVSFENHTVITAARSGQEVREHLVEHVLGYLAGVVPAGLERAGQFREDLKEALDLARNEARTLEMQLREEAPYSEARAALEHTRGQILAQAAELERDLDGLPGPPVGDEDFLLQVREVLLHPRRHLGWRRISMRVQDFGVLVREKNSTSGKKVGFLEITPNQGPAYAVFFARLGREAAIVLWPDLARGTGKTLRA